MKPWLEAMYPAGKYQFQQDSAPAHGAKTTQAWMKNNFSAIWEKEIWPPSSPGLNPLDYGIWGYLDCLCDLSQKCGLPEGQG